MNRLAFAILSLFIAVTAAAQFGISEGDAGPKATIEGSVQKRTGAEIEGSVVVTIEDGWHVNSNTPLEEFAIPTVLTFHGEAELLEATYPAHAMKAFEFSGRRELAVYDGRFAIRFRARLKGEPQRVTATLRYQACDDTVCYRPTTGSFVFTIK